MLLQGVIGIHCKRLNVISDTLPEISEESLSLVRIQGEFGHNSEFFLSMWSIF